MNYVSSVAERAILSVGRFINQAMTYAWMSSLEHRCPGRKFAAPLWSVPIFAEENDGGGDFCAPEADAPTEDDQPLE
jgi:hypothetical protein